MNVSLLKYSNTDNLGDYIQTLAVAQHLDQGFDLVDRDYLNTYNGPETAVVMNGWFTHEPENWPPSRNIIPIFWGFHITPREATTFHKHQDYLKQWEPIGCRDQATANLLETWDVEAYVSGCATMTFPERLREPELPVFTLVDQTHKHFLSRERQGYTSISHAIPKFLSTGAKMLLARETLAFYRDNAGSVVTSRIHAALPCAAMGIPTVYTGVQNGRTELTERAGIPWARTRRFPRTRIQNLPFNKISIGSQKYLVTEDLHTVLARYGIKARHPSDLCVNANPVNHHIKT